MDNRGANMSAADRLKKRMEQFNKLRTECRTGKCYSSFTVRLQVFTYSSPSVKCKLIQIL